MAKAKKTVSAKEVSADIRAGMTDEQLMQKYGLSQKGVQTLFRKLADAGVISQEQIAGRESSQQGTQAPDQPITLGAGIAETAHQSAVAGQASDPTLLAAYEVEAVAGAKGKWNLQLASDALRIESVDGSGLIEVPRSERVEKIELHTPRLMAPLLIIHERKKKAFKLDGPRLEAVTQWIGPATKETLRVGLKRRFKFCLGIGILLIVLAVPLPGDPAAGIEPLPVDVFGAALGVFLIALAFLSRYWISRNIFLLDGFWFLLVAGNVTYNVYKGDSPWWLIGSALLIYFAIGGFREFVRFKDVTES